MTKVLLMGLEPKPDWTNTAVEALVDVSDYVDHGGEADWRWCQLDRVLFRESAGVYPVKVRIPGRGQGQYRHEEVRAYRIDLDVLLSASETHAERGDAIGAFPP